MWTDVIQVEIIGKAWWDDPLPIAAILISLATFAYTWWSRRRDRASLKVKATSFATTSGSQQWNIGVRATNTGLTGSAVVDGVHFKIARKTFVHATESFIPTVTLPATMAPDASITYVVSSKGLAKELVKHGRKPKDAVPVVTTGRKHYQGKWDATGREVLAGDYNRIKAEHDKRNPKPTLGARLRKLWPL
ncbi:hypothetical protein [Paenarthrobacter sp. YJN-D]|uniref:hypothetical protein n=1 Tax=Paenarthrobacter sp. YJN-D TaxID=2735317 RepID=UPI001878BDBA|nr:hypothetical protein [Paenarthrobacter sp. YJN-D]QOT20224.1 hypothetical protein HMI60_01035 [Paenarthrobacter sp. YJN-D]